MQEQINQLTFKGQSIYVGIDVHAKDMKVSIMTERVFFKTFSAPPKPEKLYNFLVGNFPGADYHSVYEAGFIYGGQL